MNTQNLDEEEIEAAFQYCDSNHDNHITLQECKKALGYIGHYMTLAELKGFIRERFKSVDINKISLKEFVKLVRSGDLTSGEASRSELVGAFNALDRDKDGLIRVKEMKYFLTTLGEPLTEEEMKVMMKGLNEGDYLSSEDFVNLLKPLTRVLLGRECSLRTWELVQKLSKP